MPKIKIEDTMTDLSSNNLSHSDTTHPLKRAKYATDGIGSKSSSPPTTILNGHHHHLQNGTTSNQNGTVKMNGHHNNVIIHPEQAIVPYFLRSTDSHLENFIKSNLEPPDPDKADKLPSPKYQNNSSILRNEHKNLAEKVKQLRKEEKKLGTDKELAIYENLKKARGVGTLSNQVSSNFNLEKMKNCNTAVVTTS